MVVSSGMASGRIRMAEVVKKCLVMDL